MHKRDYKLSGQGGHFHIFNRGNNKQNIFLDEEDFDFFCCKLKQNLFPDETLNRMSPLPAGSFSLLAYCLMPNHFHLLLKQNDQYAAQQLLLRVCTSYSKYFNKKYQRVGHLFQDRFKQVAVDNDEQLLWLHAYINLNPQLDKIIKEAGDYKWSSYQEIFVPTGFCDSGFLNGKFNDKAEIIKFFKDALPVLKINKDLRRSQFDL